MGTIMRLRRLKIRGEVGGVYHCMTRVAGGAALLGPREREVLRKQIWKVADFCGVDVLTYCVMSNHFHVLLRVPPESESAGVDDGELVRRVRVIYDRNRAAAWEARLSHEDEAERSKAREALLARLGDVSIYMKELKQRFSIWYNHAHGRFGTLWAERFKSVLVEPSLRALVTVACYIDLNPVRAGMCEDPKDYRFCGYAQAVSGERGARRGLMRLLESNNWRGASAEYRRILFGSGYFTESGGEAGISWERLEKVRTRRGELTLAELLRCRVRYFSDGLAVGSREYLDDLFRKNRSFFSRNRKDGARRMRSDALNGLYALRDLQKHVYGARE